MRFLKTPFIILILMIAITCNQKENIKEENILTGSATVICDETLTPIIEDQIDVFESEYDATIRLLSRSESEAVNALLNDSVKIAILARDLDSLEKTSFAKRKIIPKITKFATDAIAFIRYKENTDTIVALEDVLNFINGKSDTGIKGLVFDNANSSTAAYLMKLAGEKEFRKDGIFAFNNNEDAIKYVSQNKGMIGVIGLNWIIQPQPKMEIYLKRISVLSVQGQKDTAYYSPTQSNLAEGKYPLARDLFVVNCQGYSGLGMGFASFVAGDKGQRIILKSGLLPVRIPSRKVLIRNQIKKYK